MIFDLDGTLLDSRRAIVDAVARGIEEVAREAGEAAYRADTQAIVRALGLPSDEYFREVLPARLVEHARRVKEVATGHEVAALARGDGRLFPRTLESLTALREMNLRVALVSNAQKAYFRAALDHLGLGALADHSECHEELPDGVEGAPKSRLVERALASLGSRPWAVMVGDRVEDLHAGREHGCRTVGVTHGFGSIEELAIADRRVDSLPELVEYVASL